MKKLLSIITLALAALPLSGRADEGMWMLTDLKQQNKVAMQELGLLIPIDEVYNPQGISIKDAVVRFGRGCTGEVISKEGLVLTNHHCGYGPIQQLSDVNHDYLTNGYWAMTPQEELPVKGLTVTFIDKILDVTPFVKAQLKKDKDPNGTNFLSPSYLEKVAQLFVKKEGINKGRKIPYHVELKAFYGGNRYYLFLENVYKDIRFVGAPPSSIGKFGADTDNWMWPRHTGDFSLFRIYADKNGEPAEYNPNNVPLQPKKHLTISLAGYKEGDFAFVMGFPGRNWRYMIEDEVKERMQTTNFMRHHVRDARQKVLMDEMMKNDSVRIHYASKYASSANYWKNAIGMNEGLIKLNVLQTKRNQQEQLLKRGKELGTDEYQKAFDQIQQIVKQRRQPMYHQEALGECFMRGCDFLNIPSLSNLETALKEKNSKATEKALTALQPKVQAYFEDIAFPRVEKKVGKEMMDTYKKYIPENERIDIFKYINDKYQGNSDAFIDDCFKNSIFSSPAKYKEFAQHPSLEVLENDPIVMFYNSVKSGMKHNDELMKDANKNYQQAHKVWVKGMMDLRQAQGKGIYPDANSTLRLTYGKVNPYSPKDGVEYNYYTTMKGIMEKEDPNNPEFVVPAKLKELYEKKDFGNYALPNGEMPVCFIVDTDNTGGNSGSPVFNGKGQLMGLGFDRNYEGLTGDIAFRPSSQRAACVDIRYVLFIIDKFANDQRLIKELDIVK